jgi:hypothetical protein
MDDETGDFIFVSSDEEQDIVAVKDVQLRFSKGESVVMKTKTERWVKGKIVGTVTGGEEDSFAGHSVRLDGGGSSRAALRFVWIDTDEWIAKADAGPRQGLFDAIDQNCSYEHLKYLVTSTNLDSSSFCDLIVSRAITACSYDALAWIQNEMKVDLSQIRDATVFFTRFQLCQTPHVSSKGHWMLRLRILAV